MSLFKMLSLIRLAQQLVLPNGSGDATQPCPEETPAWDEASRRCRKCYEIDESAPVWYGGRCVACQTVDATSQWDEDAKECRAYPQRLSKCDQSRFLEEARDGSCTACVSPLLVYDEDSGSCVCANGVKDVVTDGEIRCAGECSESEILVDGKCVCSRKEAFVNAATGECMFRDECAKIAVYDDARQECLQTETCKEAGLKESISSERTCVESCTLYYQLKDRDEFKCTHKCKHWWYQHVKGFCKEEKWRLIVAAVVPSVVGLLLVAFGVMCFASSC